MRYSKSFFVWLCAVSSCAVFAETGLDYCVEAQQIIAGTELQAESLLHTDYEEFVESKALDKPLTVQQYSSLPLPGDEAVNTVLSCKMKTAERINSAYPAAAGEPPVARGDGSCQAVHRAWVDKVASTIPAEQLQVSPDELVIDDEDLTFIGPMWLRPWPFEPLYRGDDKRLHIRTRALYVPFSWWIPMPDRFKGTYYCHLIAPAYLEAILRGDAVAEF